MKIYQIFVFFFENLKCTNQLFSKKEIFYSPFLEIFITIYYWFIVYCNLQLSIYNCLFLISYCNANLSLLNRIFWEAWEWWNIVINDFRFDVQMINNEIKKKYDVWFIGIKNFFDVPTNKRENMFLKNYLINNFVCYHFFNYR